MTGRGSILISGAGITGPALAYWLHRYGWRATVVERAPALRASGQNVDVRGAGRQVARLMGLEGAIAEAGTGEVGTRFLDRRGRTLAEFPAGIGDSDGATAELEILRGELVRLLVEQTAGTTEYVYDDQITAVREDEHGVEVDFARGPARRFDLVVIAEGIGSRTRRLLFGDTVRVRDLGQYTAYGTIPRIASDDRWWRWCVAGRGRATMLRPDNVGTTRASLSFLAPPSGHEDLDPERQIAVLRDVFADGGWQSARILDAFAADHSDFYLQRTAQVYAESWSRGRVALVGDAAYCASPVSGMGTSLSLTGAYVLAGEIATRGDHREAFRSYEALLRPYVAKAQKLPPGVPRVATPMSGLGVRVLQTGLRIAGSGPGRRLGGSLFTPPADEFTVPQYPARV
ncbi:FAD-dependent monooxygenase [Actinoplanes palleronii]|uniref:FAD-binding monooxygenase n=1 Tax=Actinoplanes palleronii TaxID=113570 RepID=A0ABQ4BH19_9ACTN|nr:FAD-dependent monooxygenase [Actinoplanes palleronii]GIE69958.1 FAD-binding monooxygenase [Actinoplanes palleronii]